MDDSISDLDAINWPLTPKSVIEFQDSAGDLRLDGYQTANHHYIRKLNLILDNTSSYKELKKELTEFVRDREKFTEFLDTRFDGSSCKYQL